MADHWGTFIRDAGAAFAVWKRFPLLPGISFGLALATALLNRWFIPLMFILWFFQAGWVGTERIWYLRGYRGLTMSMKDIPRFVRAFMGRYIGLGISLVIPFLVLVLPLSLLSSSIDNPGLRTLVPQILSVLFIDVLITFVTPALAFTTSKVGDAYRIGWRMLRGGWPGTAWYALFPPMAVLAVTYSRRPENFDYDLVWIVASVVAAMLNLLAKGAVAAFYLRQHDTGNDGAAFEDQAPKEEEPAEAGSSEN